MTIGKRLYLVAGLVAVIALAVAAVTMASASGSAQSSGNLDDGKDLLPQASITIEQAITAAQTAATGDIGEIDLEHYNGKLVFNVDVGDLDVKVDAATGEVLGSGED